VYFTAVDKKNPYNVYAKYGLPLYPKHWFEQTFEDHGNLSKDHRFCAKHDEEMTYLSDVSYTLPRNLKRSWTRTLKPL